MSQLIIESAKSIGANISTLRSVTSRPDGSRVVNKQILLKNKGIDKTVDQDSCLQRINDSVVSIFYRDKLGLHGGSGVVVDHKGYILTNKHVVRSAIRNNVQMHVAFQYGSGRGEESSEGHKLYEEEVGHTHWKNDVTIEKAFPVAVDSRHDMALISTVQSKEYPFLHFSENESEYGEDVYLVAHFYPEQSENPFFNAFNMFHRPCNVVSYGKVLEPYVSEEKIREMLKLRVLLPKLLREISTGNLKALHIVRAYIDHLVDSGKTNRLDGSVAYGGLSLDGNSGGAVCNEEGEIIGLNFLSEECPKLKYTSLKQDKTQVIGNFLGYRMPS